MFAKKSIASNELKIGENFVSGVRFFTAARFDLLLKEITMLGSNIIYIFQ